MDGDQLILLPFALVIAIPIGALVVRGAVAIHNRLAGDPSAAAHVPSPTFVHAAGIGAVAILMQVVVGAALDLLFSGGNTGGFAQTLAQAASIPAGVLVNALILKTMLPTSFVRGLLVALCMMLIGVVAAVGVLAFAWATLFVLK